MAMVNKKNKNKIKARDVYKSCLVVKAFYLNAKKTYRHNTCGVCSYNHDRMDCYNPCGLYLCPFDEDREYWLDALDDISWDYSQLFKKGGVK